MSLWRTCPEACSRKSQLPGPFLPILAAALGRADYWVRSCVQERSPRLYLGGEEQRGTTVVLTTHDMYEAERLCDRVAIIDHGRFVALDTPENLKLKVSGNGENVTLEEVFFVLTGKELKYNGKSECVSE